MTPTQWYCYRSTAVPVMWLSGLILVLGWGACATYSCFYINIIMVMFEIMVALGWPLVTNIYCWPLLWRLTKLYLARRYIVAIIGWCDSLHRSVSVTAVLLTSSTNNYTILHVGAFFADHKKFIPDIKLTLYSHIHVHEYVWRLSCHYGHCDLLLILWFYHLVHNRGLEWQLCDDHAMLVS